MVNSIFVFWLLVNLFLLIYVVQELILTLSAVTAKKHVVTPTLQELPKVTIQLPLYNEPFVAERLLLACMELEYPEELLEIQILDDSNDETSQIIRAFLSKRDVGALSIAHIQRKDRVGYKAGALAEGMKSAKGEFIAIFDADFVPTQSFLQLAIPHFKDENIGVVQTRWGHINESDSLLTRAQAIMLNTHFSIEQMGRTEKSAFINFNGTAGIWRKTCIEDAGGWQADTLTEDLDLSYRAQIRNWKFKYLFELETPAELPISFEAYKIQQFRWSKGAAQCVRKNMSQLWSSQSTLKAKTFGTFHLLNSSVYFLVCLLLLLSPMVYYFTALDRVSFPYYQELSLLGSLVSLLLLFIFFSGHFLVGKTTVSKVIWFLPSVLTFFIITSGISLYMAIGVLEGYSGKESAFIRTPKFGVSKSKGQSQKTNGKAKLTVLKVFEFMALLYGLFLTYKGIQQVNALVVVYGFILFVGFSLSLFFSKNTWQWGE